MDRQLTRKEIRSSRLSRFGRVSSMLIVFILINILFRVLLNLPNQIKTGGSFCSMYPADQLSARKNTVISITVPVNHFISGFLALKKISIGNVLTFSITRQPRTFEIELLIRGFYLSAYTFQKQTQIDTGVTRNPKGIQLS